MVASRGPIPKRSDMRRRTNAPEDGLSIAHAPALPANPLKPAPYWCEVAREMYESMCESGQSVFWQQSDYTSLWLVCDQLHAMQQPQFLGMKGDGVGYTEPFYARRPMTASEIGAIFKVLGSLGATEGDRRRMRIELQHGEAPVELPAGVVAFNGARRRRKGATA